MSVTDMLELLTPVARNLVTDALANLASIEDRKKQEAAAERMFEAAAVDAAADQAFRASVKAAKKAKARR